ncbi:MAG: hypothetical protein HDQ87_00355, partial [Clostridia bacterium]|nr:hypothetical protein [Clostridia bacterium]
WSGPGCLHDIIDFSTGLDKSLVDNNRLIILQPAKLTDAQLQECTSSLRQVFQFIRDAKDKAKIRTLINTDKKFRAMPYQAVQVLEQVTHTNIKLPKNYKKEEPVDMCQAIAEMIADGRQEADKRADAAEQRADAAEQRADAAEQRADAAVSELKQVVRSLASNGHSTVSGIAKMLGKTEAQIIEWIS